MTPTDKDAMALAVLDEVIRRTEAQMPTPSNRRGESTMHPCHFVEYMHDLKQARAHLASRIAEVEAELDSVRMEASALKDCRSTLLNECDRQEARATRAEAELAAVRANAERYLHLREANNADPTPFIAQRYEHGIMQWTGEEADAAVDAARGGK